MSLILEALKKAERQHKLGEVPGIRADAPVAASGVRGLGWVMLVLFAGIMLILGIYLGGYQASAPDPATAVAQIPEVRQEPPPVASPVPVQTPPATVQIPPREASVSAPPPEPELEPAPVPHEPLQLPLEPAPAKPLPAKPLNEMPSGFVANLPDLNIDIHSYDQEPAKRYVLINMEKYHEGDYLAQGPLLIEILPDGVVLEHFGERFIMPIGNQ